MDHTTTVPSALPVVPPAQPLAKAVDALAAVLEARQWRVAVAESCTGGLIAACCTDRAGSSQWFDRGFVTYSNAAKQDQLGVPAALLEAHGAVSEAVARSMALGALERSQAHLSVAVTGIAGPGGAVPGKPVGTVWMAWAVRRAAHRDSTDGTAFKPVLQVNAVRLELSGDRAAVRWATAAAALAQLQALAQG